MDYYANDGGAWSNMHHRVSATTATTAKTVIEVDQPKKSHQAQCATEALGGV